jgi:hypothetical protein
MPIRPLLAAVASAGALVACGAAPSESLAPEQVPAAFIALTQAPGRTMHMEWSGTYTAGEVDGRTFPFSAVLDFAGADYAGTITVPGERETDGVLVPRPHTEIAFVDGHAYQRTSYQGVWQSGWSSARVPPRFFDPFHGLTVHELEYVGRDERNGAQLHHLRLFNAGPLAATLFGGTAGGMPYDVRFTADESEFDIYVDDKAQPVAATLNFASASDASDFRGPSVTSTYVFSKFGEYIDIIPPPSPR